MKRPLDLTTDTDGNNSSASGIPGQRDTWVGNPGGMLSPRHRTHSAQGAHDHEILQLLTGTDVLADIIAGDCRLGDCRGWKNSTGQSRRQLRDRDALSGGTGRVCEL